MVMSIGHSGLQDVYDSVNIDKLIIAKSGWRVKEDNRGR